VKFSTRIPIRFRDLDSLGHVNNAVYHSYIEQARIDYFNEVIGRRHNWQEFGVLLARTEINYRSPILLEDELHGRMACSRMGTKSMDVSFQLIVRRETQEVRVAEGVTVLVCFDHVKQETARIPDRWRQQFEDFENE